MIQIEEHSALKEVKSLKPKHDDILVFHLHRKPIAEDALIVESLLRRIPAQVVVFMLGPSDSVEMFDDATLANHGLMRIPKAAA